MRLLQRHRSPSGHTALGKEIGGRFLLLDRIGEGRSATVYYALDRLGGPVALKLGNPCPWDIEAFGIEAKALSRMDHPAIARIVCFGAHDGAPYIALERMEGETLRDAMERIRPPVCGALRIASALSGALAHAHSRGVVHRDIKPKNIMLLPDGGIRVFDFGFATVDGRGFKSTASMGHPFYMAPEQMEGEGKCDGRADIYAAGAVLYHLICRMRSVSHYLDMLKIAGARIGPSLLVHGGEGLEKDARRIVARAMAFRPEKRFQTAGEMLDAIGCALANSEGGTGI